MLNLIISLEMRCQVGCCGFYNSSLRQYSVSCSCWLWERKSMIDERKNIFYQHQHPCPTIVQVRAHSLSPAYPVSNNSYPAPSPVPARGQSLNILMFIWNKEVDCAQSTNKRYHLTITWKTKYYMYQGVAVVRPWFWVIFSAGSSYKFGS